MPHKDGGERCLVGHVSEDGEWLPTCIKCTQCHEWIRPEDMQDDCPHEKEEKK